MTRDDPLGRLLSHLEELPGVGKKTAARYAYHILRQERSSCESLARAILDARANLRLCKLCFDYTEEDLCPVCSSVKRDRGLVCVVEGPEDLAAVERCGVYRGVYHVLHGVISPTAGVGPEELRLGALLDRAGGDEVREVILATGASVEGDVTASYLSDKLKELGVKTSRIGRGVPVGGELGYVDKATLGQAFEERKDF